MLIILPWGAGALASLHLLWIRLCVCTLPG